jgi:hypothetical protein
MTAAAAVAVGATGASRKIEIRAVKGSGRALCEHKCGRRYMYWIPLFQGLSGTMYNTY